MIHRPDDNVQDFQSFYFFISFVFLEGGFLILLLAQTNPQVSSVDH